MVLIESSNAKGVSRRQTGEVKDLKMQGMEDDRVTRYLVEKRRGCCEAGCFAAEQQMTA